MLPSSERSATGMPSSLSRRCSSSVLLRYLLIAIDLLPTGMGGHLYRRGNLVQYIIVQLVFKLYVASKILRGIAMTNAAIKIPRAETRATLEPEFDQGRHPRARIGFVLLPSEVVIEQDMFAMAPAGVGVHF